MTWPLAKREQTPAEITREFLDLVGKLDGPAEQQRVYQALAAAKFPSVATRKQEVYEREVTEAIKFAFGERAR